MRRQITNHSGTAVPWISTALCLACLLACAMQLTAAQPAEIPEIKVEEPIINVPKPKPDGKIFVERIEHPDVGADKKIGAWLGVGTEEASEALSAQLGLNPGLGLMVNYVTPDSPAAKAGLKKYDVLVECDGQSLVHPGQLRKLVQMRKAGASMKISYFRAGKKEDTTAVLVGKPVDEWAIDDSGKGLGATHDLQNQLKELPIRDAVREQMAAVREALKAAHFDQQKVQEQVRKSIEDAKRAMHDALQSNSSAQAALEPMRKKLQRMSKVDALNNRDARVIVRDNGPGSKSVVQTDESGTLVIVCNPKPHLTAHDKEGKLLFDGQISNEAERAKVPPEVWKKAAPQLKKLMAETAPENDNELEDPVPSTDKK